jgi:hypothetical protein
MAIPLGLKDEASARSVILDDDDRVAYAYLKVGEAMVADVWLYNVLEPPEVASWKDKSQMPFLNPRQFCSAERVPRIRAHSALRCEWSSDRVDIFIDEKWMARLAPGSKPGWSRLALRAGPLAKPREE